MNKPKNYARFFWILVTSIPILGLVWGIINPSDYKEWQSFASDWIFKFGILAPLVFIFIQALQVIIAPISHYTVGALGGFLFGFFRGGIYNYIGRILGHVSAYYISKKLGRKLMEKYLDINTIEKYDKIVGGTTDGKKPTIQSLVLFMIYFLPLFPDDEVSYLVGASKMKFKWFFLANLFGQLGGAFSLALIGNGISTKDPWFWILTIVTLIGFPIIWILFNMIQKRKENDQ